MGRNTDTDTDSSSTGISSTGINGYGTNATGRARPDRRPRWRRRAALAPIAVLALAACAGGDDDDAAASDMAFEPAAEEPADEPAFDDSGEAAEAPAAPRTSAPGETGIDLGTVGRDVIIEMRVSMSSDDIERTVRTISIEAAALGGGIAQSDVQFDEPTTPDGERDGYALLVVKVPPASVDTMLGRLGDAGTVNSISQSAQDVTEQLVDLDVRISNARRSVETVRSFMEQTTDLGELVALESELTRRQTELERLEAQQRNLRDRVALSTITIEVVPTPVVPDEPAVDDGSESIGDALRTGWDAFVAAVFTLGFVVAVLLPFLVIAALVGVGIWLIRRRPASVVPDVTATAPADSSKRDEESVSSTA